MLFRIEVLEPNKNFLEFRVFRKTIANSFVYLVLLVRKLLIFESNKCAF